MADVTGASLSPIYERLSSAPTYHPLEADTFADWSLEAGDVVTVTRDNRSYESPVHSSTLIWKKQPQVTISSTGNEKREAISKVSQKKFSGGGSGGLRNAENAYYSIETRYNGMRSGLILASSSASLYVENMYKQMRSGLDLTSSTAHLYVDNKYSQMTAGLKLTSSTAHLYVDNKYNQMTAGLKLTSSSAALYVNNKYNQMTAGLKLTSSTAHLYVDNKYRQMTAGLKLTSSSSCLYARSKENAAEIVARINESTGQSEIQLNANKVYIGNQRSTTVISGKLDTNSLSSEIANIPLLSTQAIALSGGLSSTSGDIRTGGTVGGGKVYIGSQDMSAAIVSATVSNNTLTLKNVNGDTVATFSKAVTLSGAWSNGSYTVTASPQGEVLTTNITCDPANAERSGSLIYIPIVTPAGTSTGYRAYANFIGKMTQHSNATDGLHRYNTGSMTTLYIKLGDDYSSVGSHYWYYKNSNSSLTTYYS